jgi:NAD(P)-dependent dehydrogenase (short-subunit alcohol dehydrogenase family)
MASKGKVAIITGARSGIGKATALAFLNDGYSVAFAGRRRDAIEGAKKEAGKNAARVLAVPTDIGDPDAVKNLLAPTRDKFGHVDVVFNNAGFGASAPIEDLTFERWSRWLTPI